MGSFVMGVCACVSAVVWGEGSKCIEPLCAHDLCYPVDSRGGEDHARSLYARGSSEGRAGSWRGEPCAAALRMAGRCLNSLTLRSSHEPLIPRASWETDDGIICDEGRSGYSARF